jgi:hypothetical protein
MLTDALGMIGRAAHGQKPVLAGSLVGWEDLTLVVLVVIDANILGFATRQKILDTLLFGHDGT